MGVHYTVQYKNIIPTKKSYVINILISLIKIILKLT